MKPLLLLAAAVALLLAPAPAQAAVYTAPSGLGVDVGLRAGIAVPTGTPWKMTRVDLSYTVQTAYPVWLDLGLHFDEHWSLGAYFQWGFTTTGACPYQDTCQARVLKAAAEAVYRFDRMGAGRPWVGVATGWEWLRISERGPWGSVLIVVSGRELVNLEAGIDFTPGKALLLGPFVSFGVGTYDSADAGTSRLELTAAQKSSHRWAQVGFRGTWQF